MPPINQYRFSMENLSDIEKSLLRTRSYSEFMTDYEYIKDENQVGLHGLGCRLLGLFSWDEAKVNFVKLDENKLVVEIQKASCPNHCYFDPLKCLNGEHDGKLKSLLKKEFHDSIANFQTFFKNVDEDSTNNQEKPDPLLYDNDKPDPPLYNNDGCVDIDFDALGVKDVRVCKPQAELELNKMLNVLNAIDESTELSLENQRKVMYKTFLQKNPGINPPRLHSMGFGPFCGQEAKYCNYFEASKTMDPVQRWNSTFFWQFKHGDRSECLGIGVSPNKFCFPFYDPGWKICYPCNTGYCHEGCPCALCSAVDWLEQEDSEKHEKEHLEEYSVDCLLTKVQCSEHHVDHPENFDETKDLEVKVHNYLDMNNDEEGRGKLGWKRVNNPPRTKGNLQEVLKLSGLKKHCEKCRKDVKDHIMNHRVLHSQCKVCHFRSRTLIDSQFWDKTCNVCKKYFPKIEKKHMETHKKGHNSDIHCGKCNKGFRRLKYLMQHLLDVHGELDRWKCELCTKSYKEERNLRMHVALRHNAQVKNFKCRICVKDFLYRFTLNRHMNFQHGSSTSWFKNIPAVKRVDDVFECETCKKVVKGKFRLHRHMRDVHSAKTFKCSECSTSFSREEKLTRHMREVHLQRAKFECDKCDMVFARFEVLNRHKSTKHEETSFYCDVCRKSFNRKDNLARHMKKHS
jgi:hypothetical protein